MKKICMLAYTYYLSDPRVRREAEALTQRGDEVDFICLKKEGELAFEIVKGVNVYRISQSRYRGDNIFTYFLGYGNFFLLATLKLTFLYFRKRYQIIHINTMPDFLVFSALIPKILGAKVILDIHDLMPELYSSRFGKDMNCPLICVLFLLEKMSCKFADRVITVTDSYKEHLSERSLNPTKCDVVMNFPDEKIFKPMTIDKDRTHFNLLYHGTLVERYGVDIAIKAVSEIKYKIPEIKFYIYGNGDVLGNLIYLVKTLGLENQICFSKRFLPLTQMPRLIATADIGITPRRKDRITNISLSTKLLEYMAMGISVITSKTEFTQKYFNDSQIMFFEPGNEKDLAEKILYLYNNPEKRKSLAENALRFFEKHNWQTEKQKYYHIVDELCL